MTDAKRLQRTIKELIEGQPDDLRLRDHLEGIAREDQFPSLTWFWGPLLYERNRVVFRDFILNRYSEWDNSARRWTRIKWSAHADRLQPWLEAARKNRDTALVRRLLTWKHAAKFWGVDEKAWKASLLSDFLSADTPAARLTVLEEYNVWFNLDEDTALTLYQREPNCRDFILQHLPLSFWGGDKRKLWDRLAAAAKDQGDEKLYDELYRRQVPINQWQKDALRLATEIQNADRLCDVLNRIHPFGYGLKTSDTLLKLLEARGRDVMPYVRGKLQDVVGDYWGQGAAPFVKIAEERGWWDLWAAAIRADRNEKLFNEAIETLISGALVESQRLSRLLALAGVSREWNWRGSGLVHVHPLKDEIAVALYRRYPDLVRGPYKLHAMPTWWQGYPLLLAEAQRAGDDELVDSLASRYITRARYEHSNDDRDKIAATADSLGDYYQAIRDRSPAEFARRAGNVLTQIPAYSIGNYDQLLRTNKLARLLFARSFEAYLEAPAAVRDLVEGSDIHVQMLAYRILSQDDDRARRMAVDSLDILIGVLLRPLHRKTRLAAFGALRSAALAGHDAAEIILARAREALRLPDTKYPKEQLVGLIGQMLHARPELQSKRERPIVYGLAEAVA